MRALIRLPALIALTASAVVSAAPSHVMAFAAWQAPPGYVEAAHDNARERIYYFAQQPGVKPDPLHWSDRVRITGAQLEPGQTLDSWFAALRTHAKQDCLGLITRAAPSARSGREQSLNEMWHCPKAALDGRGGVSLYKALLDGNQIYLLTAEGRYQAFAPGKTPLTRAQLARWIAFENSFVLCGGFLHPSCMGDAATLASAPAARMSDTEAAAAQRAQKLGRELYRQDALAWKAGAALGATRMKDIRGWIAMPDADDGGSVYFFRGNREKPELAFVVTLKHGRKPQVSAGTPKQLTPELITRFRARQTALAEQTKPCTPELNTAVLRDPGNGGWLVYTLAASRDPDAIWIGGSTRYTLAPDAVTITAARPSARGCLSTQRRDAHGNRIDDLVLTHPLGDVPDEMEVMRQLQTGLPMTIGTRTAVWRIRDGKIEKIEPRAAQRMMPAA